MTQLSLIFKLLCLSLVSLSTSIPPSLTKRATAPESTACGDVVNSEDDVIPATLAYECLTSVPFIQAVATRFMKYFYDSAQFQSNLAYLKSPPASYQQPAVDLLGGLELIQAKISNGGYANQYEFEVALQALIYSTHDGHLFLSSGVLSLFSFGSQYQIASVSIDGMELPKVYIADHLIASQDPSSANASAIATINGQNAVDYLTQYSLSNAVGGLESHADWNSLFASPAQDIQGISSIWNGGGTFYPGDTITFILENGTQIGPDPWLAIFSGASDGVAISTGGDFYNFFVLGLYPASYNFTSAGDTGDDSDSSAASSTYDSSAATSTSPSDSLAATSTYTSTEPTQTSWGTGSGFPENPIIAQPDLGLYGGGSLSGYFLKDYSLAVLSMPSFQEYGEAIGTFSETVRDFIASSKAAGMEKFLIDLQQNYGGETLLAFDTFKHFFPEITPFGGSRMRGHPPADIIGNQITTYWNGLTPDDDDYYLLLDSEWVSSDRIDALTNQNFSSWQQFFGPQQLNGDAFTTTQRYDLSNFLFDTLSTDDDNGFAVYGYGENLVNATQPYLPKDIIILTDGQCASTCALFMEMMHHEAGVRTVVAGGRPSYGPMQAPGLSRGAAAYDVVDSLDADISLAQVLLEENNQSSDFLPNRTSEGPGMSISYAQINLRDQVRKDETMPLQFTYEAANCRIFYTPQTFYNYTNLWKYAADAIFSKPALCVKDSTGFATTNASDVNGPPVHLVPPTTVVPAPPAKLGSVIMSILDDPNTEDNTLHDSAGSTLKTAKLGSPCSSTKPCSPAHDWHCYTKYVSCDKYGKAIVTPGCVPTTCIVGDHCGHHRICASFSSSTKKDDSALKHQQGFCPPPPPLCQQRTSSGAPGKYQGGGGA